MDRLTMMWTDGVYDTFNPVDIVDNEYSKINYEKQLIKLGKYEDTGLEPEDIPTVLSENEQLKAEIAHLKEKEASEVTSHSEKNILNGAISLMETVFRYMIDYMDYMGFEYDNDDDEEKPRFEMSNFEIVQRLFLSRTSNSGGTSTRAKCKELGVEDDVMINFEWSEEDETNRC